LLKENEIIDAEEVLAQNIKEEAKTALPVVSDSSVVDDAVILDDAVANDLALSDDSGMMISETKDELEDLENRTIEEEA
jgi:hypothetical protein